MDPPPDLPVPDTLLVIGVHRAELPFGRAVAARLPATDVDVLTIPDGLSGERPRPDEVFRYELTHRALYGQLLAHIQPRHRLVIDLHTGRDSGGPCADVFTASAALRAGLSAFDPERVRPWPLGTGLEAVATTVVPDSIWNNRAFDYVTLEIYLPDEGTDWSSAIALSLGVIRRLKALVAPHAA